jgi:hypothetical protein
MAGCDGRGARRDVSEPGALSQNAGPARLASPHVLHKYWG